MVFSMPILVIFPQLPYNDNKLSNSNLYQVTVTKLYYIGDT
jgi:hypothetical protein